MDNDRISIVTGAGAVDTRQRKILKIFSIRSPNDNSQRLERAIAIDELTLNHTFSNSQPIDRRGSE
jgi:hypothetical protein